MTRPAELLGLGGARPRRVVTNEELGRRLDTADEWIRSRVGIRERRIAAPEDTVVSLAAAAGRNALVAGAVEPGELDLVIVATCTAESAIPQAAAQVAVALGAAGVGAFDLNAACAGFTTALAVARDLVGAGTVDRVLVVASEKMSDWLDWDERSVAVLMGDGAAAAVVAPAADPAAPSGIGPVVWGSRGRDASVLGIPDRRSYLQMDGREVFRWASALGPEVLEVVKRSGLEPEDVGIFVPHQANGRIVDVLARSVGLPEQVPVARDLEIAGNSSAASVPLAFTQAVVDGTVAPGAHALLFAFGAGLAYAGQLVRVPARAVMSDV